MKHAAAVVIAASLAAPAASQDFVSIRPASGAEFLGFARAHKIGYVSGFLDRTLSGFGGMEDSLVDHYARCMSKPGMTLGIITDGVDFSIRTEPSFLTKPASFGIFAFMSKACGVPLAR